MTSFSSQRGDHSFSTTGRSEASITSLLISRIQEVGVMNRSKAVEPGTFIDSELMKVPIDESLYDGIRAKKIHSDGSVSRCVISISRSKYTIFLTPSIIKTLKGGRQIQTIPKIGFFKRVVKGAGFQLTKFIDISDITHVQIGIVGTKNLENCKDVCKPKMKTREAQEEKIVSICHHGKESWDLIVSDPADRNNLCKSIMDLVKTYHDIKMFVAKDELVLRYYWYAIDQDKDNTINWKEAKKLLNRLNITVSDAKKKFESEGYAKDYKNFILFLRYLKEIMNGKNYEDKIWDNIFGADVNIIPVEDFINKFIYGVQKETSDSFDLEYTKDFFDILRKSQIPSQSGGTVPLNNIDRQMFHTYLHSNINNVYDSNSEKSYHLDMDKPLSHYWINTSHNTYLTGDQLHSFSSVEMYMAALHRGCKCLELDCWDAVKQKKDGSSSEKQIPIVYHGYTLTSKIPFSDIIRCVKTYIDSNPDTYPIILSLENHCSHENQRKMAEILGKELGSSLYMPDFDDVEHKLKEELPSPNSLRGKVVIKGKRPPEPEDVDDLPIDENGDTLKIYEGEGSEDGDGGGDDQKEKPHSKIVPELAKYTLLHGSKYTNFEKSMTQDISHMHSIGEAKMSKLLVKNTENFDLWRRYNINHMTRTYPKGKRVDSSNYDPLLAWSVGCQLVALNFQTCDGPLMINDGRFRANKHQGYVLKPSWLLEEETAKAYEMNVVKMKLKIRVLNGSCLPKPSGKKKGECIDPYVRIVLHDTCGKDGFNAKEITSSKKKTHITKKQKDNGFCPMWGEQDYAEFSVYNPDLAILRILVMDSDVGNDDLVGYSSFPVASLKRGIRSVLLLDTDNTHHGPFNFATLLVDIDF